MALAGCLVRVSSARPAIRNEGVTRVGLLARVAIGVAIARRRCELEPRVRVPTLHRTAAAPHRRTTPAPTSIPRRRRWHARRRRRRRLRADHLDACRRQTSSPLTNWDPIGAATTDGTSVILTPNAMNQAGALWRSSTSSFVSFDLTAGFAIDPTLGNGGDGFAFAWVSQRRELASDWRGRRGSRDRRADRLRRRDRRVRRGLPRRAAAGRVGRHDRSPRRLARPAPGRSPPQTIETPILDNARALLSASPSTPAWCRSASTTSSCSTTPRSPATRSYLGRWGLGPARAARARRIGSHVHRSSTQARIASKVFMP